MAHCALERVTAPQRAGKRNGMDSDAFTTPLGQKRIKNPCGQGSLTGDQGSLFSVSIPRAVTKAKL